MFIGRWQPWHKGHKWLIDQRLKEKKNVLICIRDMLPDKDNPFTCEEVFDMLSRELSDYIRAKQVKLMIVPDIESINYGRGVGYEIIEHTPPKEIGEISATKIREQYKKERSDELIEMIKKKGDA
jgi:nicotinamide mononucleotide adenylyltransferase